MRQKCELFRGALRGFDIHGKIHYNKWDCAGRGVLLRRPENHTQRMER